MNSKNLPKILALDIGATHTRIAIVDTGLNIYKQDKLPTPKNNLPIAIKKIIETFTKGEYEITELALSVAGLVVDGHATIRNIGADATLSIDDFSHPYTRITMINDAAAAALLESRYHHTENLAFITISTGIGVGILSNRELHQPQTTEEELGHLKIKSTYHLPCSCGQQNHWEAYASGKNIPYFFQQYQGDTGKSEIATKTAAEIFESAKDINSAESRFVHQELGKINKYALGTIINRYRPEVIVLSGPVILENSEIFLLSIGKEITNNVKIVFPSHGDETCLLGAVAYSLSSLG